MSVRNVRFYTSPRPGARRRSAAAARATTAPTTSPASSWSASSRATASPSSAIEKYVERIPATATPSDIALPPLPARARRPASATSTSPRAWPSLGIPPEAAQRGRARSTPSHGRQVAAELSEIVRTLVWPPFREAGGTVEQLRELVHRLKPLTIAGLVTAYEQAIDESVATYDGKHAR